jgi:hypothetical protein
VSGRVEVVVPGPEGTWIARALREAEIEVGESPGGVADGATVDAALVVLATTVDGFEGLAASLARRTQVVAVGWDPIPAELAPRLSLAGFFVRPVALGQLTRLVRRLLDEGWAARSGHGSEPPRAAPDPRAVVTSEPVVRTEPSRSSRSSIPPPPSGDVELPEREPTLQLPADDLDGDAPPPREPTLALGEPEVALGIAPSSHSSSRGSSRPPPPREPTSSGTTAAGRATACFSPRLEDLLRRADRRLFPESAPLDLRFPGGDEPAHELVPDELLAEVATPLDPAEPDPLEAFTFVGAPDAASVEASMLESAVGSSVSRSGVASEPPPRTSSTGRTPGTVRERSMPPPPKPAATSPTFPSDLTREGTLAPGGALRLLWQLQDRARPLWLHLDVAGGPEVRLGLRDGKLVAFEGPAHRIVAAELREMGRWRTAVEDEAAAETLLREAVERGTIDRFELATRLRHARETLLHQAATAHEAQFALRPPVGELPTRPLLPNLVVAIASEGARRRLGTDVVLRWLGHDAVDRLVLLPSFATRAEQLGLEPELVEAFEAAADHPVMTLLHGLAASVGAAGALFALASCDALRLETASDVDDVPPEAVRALLRRARARAEVGSYFAILELAPDASERDIVESHRRLRRELVRLDLDALGLEELEGDRQDALAALDEALAHLGNARLRAVYAAALARGAS